MLILSKQTAARKAFMPILALLFIQLTLLYTVGHLARLDGVPLDDAWIHQVIARNLAERGELGFLPGHFGSAATSLLWPILLSLPFFFGSETASIYALLLNSGFYLAIGCFIYYQLSQLADRWTALIFSIAFVISGNFIWFAFSGMEAMLQIFLVCMTILTWESGRKEQRFLLPALLATALVFTRIETLFLPAALVFYEHLRHQGGSKARRINFLLLTTVGITAIFLLNFAKTGQLLPPTLEGRRWLWLLTLEGIPYHQIVMLFPYRWLDKLSEFSLGTPYPTLAWAASGVALYGALQLWRSQQHPICLLLLFQAIQLLVYALILPVEGHAGRYQPLMPALYTLSLCYGVYTLCIEISTTTHTTPSRTKPLALTLVAGLLTYVFSTTVEWGNLHAKAVEHIDATEVAMGKHVATLPETEKIASFDIGGIAFFSRRPIVDMGGLSDPTLLPFLKSGKTLAKLTEEKVTTLVVPQGYDASYPDPWNFLLTLGLYQATTKGVLQSQHALESTPEVWGPAFRAMLHSAPRQEAYRLCSKPPCQN